MEEELGFDDDETLVLTLMQQLLLGRDLIAERDSERVAAKTAFRDEFARAAAAAYWSRGSGLPEWAREPAVAIAARPPAHQRRHIEAAAPEFGARIEGRARALLLLVELVAFSPPAGWVPRARRIALAVVAGHLPALRVDDLDVVTAEFAALTRALTRRNVRWGRVAAVSAIGFALGMATMGVAAPLIGAAVGGTLGLSGAAATSAGLATLGGGSIAAGGFGMAGGTAVLSGLGALGGGSIAAVGARVSGWSAAAVVAEAVKLDVITRLVILDAEHDDEKARRVVEGLQARLNDVTAALGRLAEQLRVVTAENDELRGRLQAEHDDAEIAETVLEVVIDRLSDSV